MNQKHLAIILGTLAIAWYYISLFWIGLADRPLAEGPAQFMTLSITTIGSALATFVGGLLGVRQVARTALPAETPNYPQMPSAPVEGGIGGRVPDLSGQGAAGRAPVQQPPETEEEQVTTGAVVAALSGNARGMSPQQQRIIVNFATSTLQWIATLLYVLSLGIALWMYFRNPAIDPAISTLGKTILGLFGGALAIVLNASQDSRS